MKIKEVSEKFNVSMTALRYYEKVGLFDDVQRVQHVREYKDRDIERLSVIITLKNAGLHIQSILKYIQLSQEDRCTTNERICILKKQRQELLDEIHQRQKSLDSLDYLIYDLKSCEHREDIWKPY